MPPKAEIRELLKQRRAERQQSNRISHRCAEYDGQGRLMCNVCHKHIKSESIWQAHLGSATHKENIQAIKFRQQNDAMELKRRAPSGLNEVEESKIKRTRYQGKESNEKEGDDDEDVEEDDEEMDESQSQLPAEFFDIVQDEPLAEPQEHQQKEKPASNSLSDIPAGFFDNATEEALVRKEPASNQKSEDRLEAEFEAFKAQVFEPTEDDEALDAEQEEKLLLQHIEMNTMNSRVEQLKMMREQKSASLPSNPSTSIDSVESEISRSLKSSIRDKLKSNPAKKIHTVYDDMEDDDEDNNDDDDDEDDMGWRAQRL